MRIVWLAAADARGHLMRAHVVRQILGGEGVRVDVVTTSSEGRAFLAALGTPAEILSCHYGVAFDDRQNMERARTEACVLRYLFTPSRGAKDLGRLAAFARGAALVVNDFHPLLLVAGSGSALPCPLVHVYGENLWRAIAGNFEGRAPALVGRGFGALLTALRDRAYARVEHTPAAPLGGDRDGSARRLPPIVAAPRRAAAEVRAALGVPAGARLAAVHLNPHFADPRVAEAVLGALGRGRFHVHAVGEGFAMRAGFRPYDPAFVDVAAAADVLVSAPGMGAVAQARVFGMPFAALVTDQPEQRANLRFLSRGVAAVELDPEGSLADRLHDAVTRLVDAAPAAASRPLAAARVAALHALWGDTFVDLAAGAPAPARGAPARLHHPVSTHEA